MIHSPFMANILVVDDEKALQELIAAVLQRDGHGVRAVQNGEECLSALGQSTPDLIIMDITMPGMDGYTLMTHLSSDGATRDIPVVIVSGKDSLRETFQQFSGVAEFFSKPFDIKVLRDRVQDILAARGR